jgi:glutamate decarboxylase
MSNAIVNSETWKDANPMLNLSSFVTTYCEPEAKDIYDRHMYRNFADPDMYPQTQETEFKWHSMAARPLEWPGGRRTLRSCDHWFLRGLHVGRPGPQMELAGGST